MGGPGNTSSDILGIEVGRRVVRGVRLDQETTELTAASECFLDGVAVSADGIIDAVAAGPAVDQVIDRLGVQDRNHVRVGLSIGPRNAGVGSGPSMTSWLEAQAVNLREPMICSGGLGISFAPSRAVDAALKLASGSGIDLVRVDLAPVAGARAIGDQVDDVICLGSGRGWQARMRDFEVLEAMENAEIGEDDALSIVGSSGPRFIARYGWVEISAELDQAQRLEIGQLAPAVGAAIGVAYESPANLLLGKEVACGLPEMKPRSLGTVPDDYRLEGKAGEQTLQLAAKIQVQPKPAVERRPEPRPQRRVKPTAAQPVGAATVTPKPIAEAGRPEHLRRIAPPRSTSISPRAVTKERPPVASRRPAGVTQRAGVAVAADPWGDSVDESDPIAMFSPENHERYMLGKRDSRFNPNVVFVLLLLSAIALMLVYRYV